jgi:energy-coupling factor transporter ATP-binding protein EcfA2
MGLFESATSNRAPFDMNKMYERFIGDDSTDNSANDSTDDSANNPIDDDISSRPGQSFKLPIYYTSHQLIDDSVLSDVDILYVGDNTGIYGKLLSPESRTSDVNARLWGKAFSTDKSFIEDTQRVIRQLSESDGVGSDGVGSDGVGSDHIHDRWNEITQVSDKFLDKYNYISPPILRGLNHNSRVLQIINLYIISSPVMSLIFPILALIFPFAILRMRGIHLTLAAYFSTLRGVLSNHPMGRIIGTLGSVSWDKVVYLIFTLVMYIVQIIQNVRTCIRYYRNITSVHDDIRLFREFAVATVNRMDLCVDVITSTKSNTYKGFVLDIESHKATLEEFITSTDMITDGFSRYTDTGRVMKIFYYMHSDERFNCAVEFMFGFFGYMENMMKLSTQFKARGIHFGVVCNPDKPLSMTDGYHPLTVTDRVGGRAADAADAADTSDTPSAIVTNTYNLGKNMVISGPNASGKTTLLKSTLVNAILTQQIGCGFYSKCETPLFHRFHSYLNIPDTSGRDSLFQAEARRCKDIIDSINGTDRILCVMDELFSGTNPEEAVAGSAAFISYMEKQPNISFVLTTHYTGLCKRIKRDKSGGSTNYHMKSTVTKTGLVEYTYQLAAGISKIKGGTSVMEEIGFPDEIVSMMKSILHHT